MGRLTLGFIGCVGAILVLAQSASAASVSVSATATSSLISITATGSADVCESEGCMSQSIEVETDPDPTSTEDCSIAGNPQRSTPIPITGGAFTFNTTISVGSAAHYQVCAYIASVDGLGFTDPTSYSSPVNVTIPPAPCQGTPHTLSLQVPSKLAYGREGLVAVNVAATDLKSRRLR